MQRLKELELYHKLGDKLEVDIGIINGTIIDGSGAPGFLGNVLIRHGKIDYCGKPDAPLPAARRIIDAQGKIVCPGFVDTHTHSDLLLLWNRQHASALQQGVTTEIIGQDGMSYAPMSKENLHMYVRYAAGCNGHPNIDYDWQTGLQYMKKFKNCGINTAWLVPHCALRLETVGMQNIPLTGKYLEKAKNLLELTLREGAKGFSTGLSYLPNYFSDTSELIELCKVVAYYNGVFAIHLRTIFQGEPFDPIEEAFEIARKSGVKLHFSHFKTNLVTAGQIEKHMEKIDSAISEGLDISLELYPYAYGASLLQMFLPSWIMEGGLEKTLRRLSDSALRKKAEKEINTGNIPNSIFCNLPMHQEYLGMSFHEVAQYRGQSLGEMICDILLAEELCAGFYDQAPETEMEKILENDCMKLLMRPDYMVGSDAIIAGEQPHPRAFGTFPKLLRLAREKNIPFETIINRMTQKPCDRFSLSNRGLLGAGKWADIVIFDPLTVSDTAKPENARTAPKGIDYVIVNGKIAVQHGAVTGILNGTYKT